ncbi:MAG: hypothetical protein GXY55_06160 [Phycisphaerae bacterium]|nr:hypothetical protein [Phycisphaerae bacterium]
MISRRTTALLKRVAILGATAGATLFQTTGCTADDLLAAYGLSSLLTALRTAVLGV